MRWMTNFFYFRFKSTSTAGIGIHPTKAWSSQLVNFKIAIWTWGHFRRMICNKIVLNLEKMPQKRMECFRLLFDHLAWIEHQFLSSIRDSRKAGSLRGMVRGVGGVRKSIHQSWLAKGLSLMLGLGLLCWVFKGVQDVIQSEEVSTLQIGSVAFPPGQCTSAQPILVTDYLRPRWASRQFLTLPIVQTLLPMTLGYSLSSDAVDMRQFRRWKRLWRRSLTRSHKRIFKGPSRSCCNGTISALQPWGDYFEGDLSFMCVLSIKVPIRKKSGNLFNDHRISHFIIVY